MQTEKSVSEEKRIMPETRYTEFPALSVGPKVDPLSVDPFGLSFLFDSIRRIMTFPERRLVVFAVTSHLTFRVLTSLLTSLVSCLTHEHAKT